MQFFAQVVVDVAADPVERSAEASGTVVIPFPGGSGGGTGSGTGGSDGTSESSKTENDVTGNASGNEDTGSTDDISGRADAGSGSGSEFGYEQVAKRIANIRLTLFSAFTGIISSKGA